MGLGLLIVIIIIIIIKIVHKVLIKTREKKRKRESKHYAATVKSLRTQNNVTDNAAEIIWQNKQPL